MKRVVFIAMVGFSAIRFAMADTDYEGLRHVADQIVAKMPSTWRVVEKKSDVVPYGHYYGLKYAGPRGVSLVLEGARNVLLHWKDSNGAWHQESLAKESLEVWIMPPGYHRSWKRFFVMKSPAPAEEVFSGKKARVYGYPSHHIEPREEFEEIMSSLPAVSTKWPDSPRHTGDLSWGAWKKDIKEILRDSG